MSCENASAVIGIIGTLIGIVGTIAALYFGLRSNRRNQKIDDRSAASMLAKMETKLEYVADKVTEISNKTSKQDAEINEIKVKQAETDASVKYAHERIDKLEAKLPA